VSFNFESGLPGGDESEGDTSSSLFRFHLSSNFILTAIREARERYEAIDEDFISQTAEGHYLNELLLVDGQNYPGPEASLEHSTSIVRTIVNIESAFRDMLDNMKGELD
jgi:hypothetical protein